MSKSYVVGFIYDGTLSRVLLQHKNRGWQKGRINGVGGEVNPEDFDSPDPVMTAMKRETKEEVSSTRRNFDTSTIQWNRGPRVIFQNGVYLFVCFAQVDDLEFLALTEPEDDEDAEELTWYNLDHMPADRLLVEHVAWLVPLGKQLLGTDDGLSSIHYSHGALRRL